MIKNKDLTMSSIKKDKKNEECVFDGYIEDIKKAFVSVYGREPNGGDSEVLVSTLHAIINSYYFEGLYEYSKVGISNDNQYFLKTLPNKYIEKHLVTVDGQDILLSDYTKKVMGESRRRMPKNAELPISLFNEYVDFNIGQIQLSDLDEIFIDNRLDISLVVNELKKINPKIYELLFEENDLKQNLILKSKKDLVFDIVPVKELTDYLNKTVSIQNVSNIYEFLNKNYDLRYFVEQNNNSNLNDFVVISHNDFEIGGIAVFNMSNETQNALKTLGQKGNEYSQSFMKVSSIMVSKNYRGQGIGVDLFEKAMEEATAKNHIIIFSDFTELGRNFLKPSIDKLIEKESMPVIKADWFNTVSNLLPAMFTQSFSKGREHLVQLLTEMREFEKSIHEKKMTAGSSQDFFAIEDEEADFKSRLLQRKFDKKMAKPSL